MNVALKLNVLIIISTYCCSGFTSEIYKSIDKDGNVTFSSTVPMNSTVVETVNEKKLIKKISIINGASSQNKKIKAITQKLKESRIKRNKARKKLNENYNNEITLIKNQRIEGLKNLTNGKSVLNSSDNNKVQIKDSIKRMLEQQD